MEINSIKQELMDEIIFHYTQLFSNLPHPKDDLMHIIVFLLIYIAYTQFFKQFPIDHNIFAKPSFLFECFTITYNIIYGVQIE